MLLLYVIRNAGKTAVEIDPNGVVADIILGIGEKPEFCRVVFGGQHLQNEVALADSGLSNEVTVEVIVAPPRFDHKGSWTGCGGNPSGTPRCNGSGNCSGLCVDCGASTRWSCCGSAEEGSAKCLPFITEEQASRNYRLCGVKWSEENEKPWWPPGAHAEAVA